MKKINLIIIALVVISIMSSCSNKALNNDTKYEETRIHGELLKVGEKLPAISIETNKGDTFNSSKTEKPIVINCWATW